MELRKELRKNCFPSAIEVAEGCCQLGRGYQPSKLLPKPLGTEFRV